MAQMKARVILCLTTLLVAVLWAPAGHAADAVCLEIREMIVGQTYVAKEPLYDTKVDSEGIIKLERDKQEIPKGAQFKVLKVECEGGKLEIKLRQVAHKKVEAVGVNFLLTKNERLMPNAIEQFQQIADHVWEEVPEEE
jgi:hypothetical protein